MCQTPCIEACVWSGCGWVCPVSAAAPPRCREKVGAMPGPRPPAFIEQFYLSIKIFLFLPSLHKNICCQDAEAGPEHPLAGPGRKASVRTPTTPPATTPVKIFAHELKIFAKLNATRLCPPRPPRRRTPTRCGRL